MFAATRLASFPANQASGFLRYSPGSAAAGPTAKQTAMVARTWLRDIGIEEQTT